MKSRIAAACLALFCCTDAGGGAKDPMMSPDAEAVQTGPDGSARRDGGRDATNPSARRDGASEGGGGAGDEDAGDDTDARVEEGSGSDAGSDAGVGGGAVGCDGLKFCDDFEGSALNALWVDKQGTVELDTSRKMRGKKSLHVRTENNKPAIIAHRASFPMPNERFWVRMFLNIKNLPTPDWSHWSFMWTIPEGKQWAVVEHRLGGQNTTSKKLFWGVGSDHGPSGDWTNIDESSVVPLDKWQCIELMIDSNADVSDFYREGVKIPGMSTTRTTKHAGNSNVPYDLPAMRALYVGFFYYQGQTPGTTYELWIDDLAIDSDRIGCER